MGLGLSRVLSSIEHPARPAAMAPTIVSATPSGESAKQFSRSADTGRSVASTTDGGVSEGLLAGDGPVEASQAWRRARRSWSRGRGSRAMRRASPNLGPRRSPGEAVVRADGGSRKRSAFSCLVRTSARSGASGGVDDEHRARRGVGDRVRDAAEDALGALHALVADDDQLHLLVLGDRHDAIGDGPEVGVGLRLDRLACGRSRRCLRARCRAMLSVSTEPG